jgi:hypothetical protein
MIMKNHDWSVTARYAEPKQIRVGSMFEGKGNFLPYVLKAMSFTTMNGCSNSSYLAKELLFKTRYWRKDRRIKVTAKEEEDVNSYWMTLRKRRGYWILKEEALARTVWITRCGKVYGPILTEPTEWINEYRPMCMKYIYIYIYMLQLEPEIR